MTDAGEEFYHHAVLMLREAELAETAIRHRLNEPKGTVHCTAAVATMQFAMRDIVPDFLLRYPKVDVVAHATDQNVDIVGENYDIAIRAPKWLTTYKSVQGHGHDQRLLGRLLDKLIELIDNHISEFSPGVITHNVSAHVVKLHRIRDE